ncbi:MAG: ABC transporter ATP-binding protein [Bacteroidetes bacterium]|nr:ABC transporter ATP-binding protein [Bacteroidota bacterium]
MSPRIEAVNLGKQLGGRWALRRLDVHVNEGEVLGIIGANGAGKSTLLKTLSGLLHPDEGSYRVRGSLASLLEVGTGFHPDLSGRENAFLRGALLGLSRREVEVLLPRIAEFAGVADRLDEPVKYYSSGMQLRLGFSVAAHLPADTLIVDEVLAVGDAAFQAKSLTFLETSWRAAGRSVVYVAHQLNQVRRLCDRVLWLDHGTLRLEGHADEVCDAYLASMLEAPEEWPDAAARPGLGGVRATALHVDGTWSTGSPAQLRVEWTGAAADTGLDLRISLERPDASALTLWSSLNSGWMPNGASCATLTLPELALSSGTYLMHLRVFVDGLLHDEVRNAARVVVQPGAWQGFDYPTPRPMALQTQRWS